MYHIERILHSRPIHKQPSTSHTERTKTKRAGRMVAIQAVLPKGERRGRS
jgi:hypothetical protein